jgi:hypothetical protein
VDTQTGCPIVGTCERMRRCSIEAGSTLSVLVLLLNDSLLSLEDCFSVLVELKLSDHAVGGVDGNLSLLS